MIVIFMDISAMYEEVINWQTSSAIIESQNVIAIM